MDKYSSYGNPTWWKPPPLTYGYWNDAERKKLPVFTYLACHFLLGGCENWLIGKHHLEVLRSRLGAIVEISCECNAAGFIKSFMPMVNG